MKSICLVFSIALVALFADDQAKKPSDGSRAAEDPGLSQLEMTQAEALRAHGQTLDAQDSAIQASRELLRRDAVAYEAAVKAAHPTLKIHWDIRTMQWMRDAEPTATPGPPAIPPMKQPPPSQKEEPKK